MVDFIVNESFQNYDTVVIDTDIQKLSHSKASYCLYLGSDKKFIKKEVNEQIEDLFKFIQKAKIIFLLTGLGGRTGEVVTLQLAKFAIEKNKIVHVLAVTPFKEEGNVRNEHASLALKEIKELANTVTAISNNEFSRLYGNNVKLVDSFNVLHKYWLKIINDVYVKPGEHLRIISSHVDKINNEGFSLQ